MTFDRPTEGALCDVAGCLAPATFRMGFRVWATKNGRKLGAPAQAFTGLVVCVDHQDSKDPFDDNGWTRLAAGFMQAGYMAPDRSTLEMTYSPIP